MFTRHNFPILWMRVRPYLTHPEAPKTMGVLAVAALGIGAGVIAALPAPSTDSPSPSTVSSPAEPKQTATTDSVCEQQAWPYIDQRCAASAAHERGTRQVRVVTDRGAVLTMTTPMPIVEPKRPAPSRPTAVARTDEKIGPEVVAPAAPEQAQEATLQKAVAQSQSPKAAKSDPDPLRQQVATAPALSPQSPPPMTQPALAATSAFAKAPAPVTADLVSTAPEVNEGSISKKAKAAAKAADKQTKQRPAAEDAAVPAEVVAAVEASVRRERGRQAPPVPPDRTVPPEVIAAVESATGDATRGYDVRPQRIYVIQRTGW